MGLDEPLDVEAELAILSLLLDGDVEICQQLTDLLKKLCAAALLAARLEAPR